MSCRFTSLKHDIPTATTPGDVLTALREGRLVYFSYSCIYLLSVDEISLVLNFVNPQAICRPALTGFITKKEKHVSERICSTFAML